MDRERPRQQASEESDCEGDGESDDAALPDADDDDRRFVQGALVLASAQNIERRAFSCRIAAFG
ncbi:hypothetical protein JOJ86_002423 [Rhodococcus percolatus]|uniref:hypothetical protein n=1 Tax=Rhodococcus TaxID=1827 RepID=UPI0015FD28AA|nr:MULTISPECIES: hypothetical protein [Rhodococcus]MBA8959132.1 hypothetical protein [Rhodococcus opacus]MBP2204697.1 hypothetical protein [Rhodococcus opacus]MDI9935140.1 hypothetical protein [Rhodococcus sp. IEGM 1351]MDV6241420.1 hypothetical protein [Rhodococcus opacus]